MCLGLGRIFVVGRVDLDFEHISLFIDGDHVTRSVEDDDWDHLDFERDDHLEEFCRERLNRVCTMMIKMMTMIMNKTWPCGSH